MKALASCIVILGIVCPPTAAVEPLQSHRFSIVQAASRTILIDNNSGESWVLDEDPVLHWQPIQRGDVSSLPPASALYDDARESQLTLKVETRRTPTDGRNGTIKATVTNRTATACKDILVSFTPSNSLIIKATDGAIKLDTNHYVWKIKRLEVNESKIFEAVIQVDIEASGKSTTPVWAVQERSQAPQTKTVHVDNSEPN
ncbi:hypothetical protein EC9_26870 [Rosistilla ulvae]|uniref:Uncharacterized protein n=1 Tax=Rosistilla ulvae TaxID=1930277 RepID=A0A517M0W7_9BACT|nr:hypothetical protein [Rosistilla ulvae]QDS88496.1 hypothetical protein EC9_26870 [Rosistilla ulvae]